MRKVRRDELLDYATYGDRRGELRPRVLELKRARRIHLLGVLTFLFENPDTIRYQVQEMMRVERLVREADIQHELATYNALLPEAGGLPCTLLIELEDEAERDEKLRRWRGLSGRVYAVVAGGERVPAVFDPTQVGEDRLSSVQYLQFPLDGRPPVALGVDHEELRGEVELSAEQREALAADLADGE